MIDISRYDVIVGYRADDSYFSFVQDFIMGTISLQKLSMAMKLGDLNDQIVLKSQKAFEQLSFVSYEKAEAVKYYHEMARRDKGARKAYLELKPSTSILDEIYILDIMRGGVSDDKLRIR